MHSANAFVMFTLNVSRFTELKHCSGCLFHTSVLCCQTVDCKLLHYMPYYVLSFIAMMNAFSDSKHEVAKLTFDLLLPLVESSQLCVNKIIADGWILFCYLIDKSHIVELRSTLPPAF
jgi:hypothetical protein